MNNRFLGNASCLTKYDLLVQVATTFNLPVWYITMLTEPVTRNKGDRNATNYRLGSKNAPVLASMKELFYSDGGTISDVGELLRNSKINIKMIAARNNTKAGNYRIGYTTHFSHKDRNGYFEGMATLIDAATNQVIFLDPDTGVTPAAKKLDSSKGSSSIRSQEMKAILDSITDESIIMVQQQLTNYLYTHTDRVKDLKNDLQPNIILLIDEVIQSGIYFITKSQVCHDLLLNLLLEYVKNYQFVKNSERVILISGNKDGITIQSPGAPVKNIEENATIIS